jgi:hypothetical protein
VVCRNDPPFWYTNKGDNRQVGGIGISTGVVQP